MVGGDTESPDGMLLDLPGGGLALGRLDALASRHYCWEAGGASISYKPSYFPLLKAIDRGNSCSCLPYRFESFRPWNNM